MRGRINLLLLCLIAISAFAIADDRGGVVLSKIEKPAVENTKNKDASATAEQETIPAQRQQEIIELLRQDCGACHGMNLLGGLGPSLQPQALEKLTEDQIVETISNGRSGTPMPPWKPFFNEQELHWLAQQLKHGIEDNKNENP